MKQIIVFLLLGVTSLGSLANPVQQAVQKMESEWAQIYYSVAKEQQGDAYTQLLTEINAYNRQYPDQAELIIQQAIVVASNAEYSDPVTALSAIYEARDLLLHAIALNPTASEGAAYVMLGSLYYQVPAWPIAYGDNAQAKAYLEKALAINPNGIDANYFYADFLRRQGNPKEALSYFYRALNLPVRENHIFADTQLQIQAEQLINQYKQAVVANGVKFSVFRNTAFMR